MTLQRSLNGCVHSISCYSWLMSDRGNLLRDVMLETSTSQAELARASGVHQPSISQFLSGQVDFSDEQLARLLACMGRQLIVTRVASLAQLTRSERRSWSLHRRLSTHLNRHSLDEWRPTIERNLHRLRGGTTGEPHTKNLERWASLVTKGDLIGIKRALTGLDRDSIEMREVSPFGGVLSQEERAALLDEAS